MSGGLHSLVDGVSQAVGSVGSQPVFGCVALFLGLVFIVSSMPKIRKPDLAAMALTDFGITRTFKKGLGLASGAVEMLIAVSLVVAAFAQTPVVKFVPVVVAAILLWGFVALLARALRRSENFACFCFGGGESTISRRSLIRTISLATVATILAIAATGSSPAPTLETAMLQLIVATSALVSTVLIVRLPSILEVTS